MSLQIATESFAVPKSVMKAIGGLCGGEEFASPEAGTLVQPTEIPVKMRKSAK